MMSAFPLWPAFAAAAMSAVLAAILARIGLARLDPGGGLRARGSFAVSCAGAGHGILLAWLSGHLGATPEWRGLACIPLAALLACSAWLDLRAGWAPTEVILPLAMAAGAASVPLAAFASLAAGAILLAACWAAWIFQRWLGRDAVPPADLLALGLPVLLFGVSGMAALFHCALSLLLLGIRLRSGGTAPFRLLDRFAFPGGRIRLLAATGPLLLIWMTAGALLGRTGGVS